VSKVFDKKGFGKYLENLRLNSGFVAQIDLAKISGVSKSTISRMEAGETETKPETLKKLAPFLKVSYSDLMKAAGYMETKEDYYIKLEGAGGKIVDLSHLSEKEQEYILDLAEKLGGKRK
jgi:transcriptional regulator with XRE-family HTH domain